MHNYAGSSASYPANVRIVDDSDPPNAANLMAGVMDLADRTAFLDAQAILGTGGSISGALNFLSGSVVNFESGSSLFLQSGSLTEIDSGATLFVDGGGVIEVRSGGLIELDAGSLLVVFGAGGIKSEIASGIQATAPGGFDSMVPGGFRLNDGSSTNTALGSFANARTKSYQFPLALGVLVLAAGWNGAGTGFTGPGDGGATSQGSIFDFTHDGATLASVIVTFQVADPHAGGAPGVPPTIDIRRIDLQAAAPAVDVSLRSGGPVGFTTGGSGAAWYAGGNLKQQVFTCDQNNVINNARYVYYAKITDEGTAPGNTYWALSLTHANILDTRAAQ